MKIGFVGLGHMGFGMAANLLKSRHAVTVYNRTRAKTEPLVAQGAKAAADSHAGCAKGCIKRGDKAVLVTTEGKVYQIANQDKVVDHAGQKVTLVAEADGENLTVSEVK